MKGPGIRREDEGRTYIDDCLDQIHRIACGRPCPDRDHCRTRLIDILHAIVLAPRFEEIATMIDLAKRHEETEMDLSRVAYEAYSDSLGGRVPETESPLPPFDALPDKLKAAWKAVAYAVVEQERQGPEGGLGPPQVA